MPPPLEVAVFSAADGLKAQSLGASRVELNAPGSYPAGGLTSPSSELIALATKSQIPIRVMIRPRGPPSTGSDFIYTPEELAHMRSAILAFKELGVLDVARGDGFVFGILRPAAAVGDEYAVDEDACMPLVEAARPFECVYHRAFDPVVATDRWADGADALVRCGFRGLLTAGGHGNYNDNPARLDELCRRLAGKVQVVVGGGVRHHNLAAPVARLAVHGDGAVWLHSAALAKRDGETSEHVDEEELTAILEGLRRVTSA